MEIKEVTNDIHLKLAKDLFNLTWDLIEKSERTAEDDEKMIYAANASRFHWGYVGTSLNFARGEWQISRVYALLKRSEPALYHAKKSLELCLINELGELDLGFAYEAMARAATVQGDQRAQEKYLELAEEVASKMTEIENQSWLLKNIKTVKTNTIPTW
ncbi:hypothetical protein H1D32_05075 [Anaerobacillus sp. CMMVII]|uniref:hypothetical protein n=1 Tax=Anaerobacillus sp. CMMVII TaxID=2755588 RepID=UPI0021B79AEB|nr:hypothetical protein [Anaerobacillus sp. CMMVII]MCT8137167.1 hypothetical protein [Anaerobacillus sp. CMMVII]